MKKLVLFVVLLIFVISTARASELHPTKAEQWENTLSEFTLPTLIALIGRRIAAVTSAKAKPLVSEKQKGIDEAKDHFNHPEKYVNAKYEGRNSTSFDGLVIPQNAGGIVTSTDADEL